MSYITPSLDDLIAILNKANSTTFTKADLTISVPQVVSGTWHAQVTNKNTAIRFTAPPQGTFQGTAVVLFDRLNLASLANAAVMPGFRCSAYHVTSVHGLLPMLFFYTGMVLGTDDVEDTPLVDAGHGNGDLTAVISAKPGSVGWVGSVSLNVTVGGAPMDQILVNTNLPGLNYPTANDQDTYGLLYLYGYDFTTYFNTVAPIAPGVLTDQQADALVVALKATDISPAGKLLWTNADGVTAWNLKGATVLSNGLNSSSLPTNPAYKYVMALKLADGVLTPAGTMYLHYNDPFDPNAS